MWALILIDTQLPPTMAKATVVEVGSEHVQHSDSHIKDRLEICQKIYTTEDFRVKNLHRKRVIFDIC